MSVWGRNPASKSSNFLSSKLLLVLGLLVTALAFCGPEIAANPPSRKDPEVDDKPPLPTGEDHNLAERIKIPNPDRAIFTGLKVNGNFMPRTGIVDFEPIASEDKNRDEYLAWREVIEHAKKFTRAQIENHARRDLTRDDLIGLGPPPREYRLQMLRFEGKISRVRRLEATKALQEVGTKEVYEAELMPLDDPPTDVVSFVFTELPAPFSGLAQKPVGEWQDIKDFKEINDDAVCAGYFFKVKENEVPVLIGKSVSLLPKDQPSALKSGNPIDLDKNLKIFNGIKEDTRVGHGSGGWEEAVAWNKVLLHARRFSPEELEKHARTDLKFADLFEEIRKDYKLQLVRFEGRLLMLRKMELSQKLKSAGVKEAYEGWLSPQDEPKGNPVCIVFTDPLPEGIEPGRTNKWVSFAGYSFKLMRYESGERDKDEKRVTKRAPLLLGRAIVPQLDPDRPSSISWSAFVQIAIAVVLVLGGIAGGLTLWFRRGDRRARSEIAAQRSRNPFESSASQAGGVGP